MTCVGASETLAPILLARCPMTTPAIPAVFQRETIYLFEVFRPLQPRRSLAFTRVSLALHSGVFDFSLYKSS